MAFNIMGDICKNFFMSKKFYSVFLEIDKSGYIAGLRVKDSSFCLAAALNWDYFLTGLEVLGIFCLVDGPAEDGLTQIVKDNLLWLKVELENPIVLVVQKLDNSVTIKAKSFSCNDAILKDINVQYFSHNPAIILRAVGKMPLMFETSALPGNLKDNYNSAVEKFLMTIRSQTIGFHLKDSSFILTAPDRSQNASTCGNLKQMFDDCELSEILKRNIRNFKKQVSANFNILLQVTGDAAVLNTANHSLVIHCQQKSYRCASMNLPLDVLIICSEVASLDSVFELFLSALQKQLRSMSECFVKHIKDSNFTTPVPHHFCPDTWDVPFTVVYPHSESDEDLESYRKNLHELLLLPLSRPALRKCTKWTFDETPAGKIINPHEAIMQSGAEDNKPSIISGRYTYYHYMQDHIDDSGWGCAYRSLQTIISWFRFQGYTEREIPSHSEIQQALVDVGDKPKSFVGSRKWIGSQEVSFCLDHLIKIQSKIMCVSSGSEMANKGRELSIHFKEQGTPVMIGGGVLAHTIIGVDFCESTGDLKFLVLDPHYTGPEDLNTIINKGWCGWKGVHFWDQNAFYNLCLPQRPKGI